MSELQNGVKITGTEITGTLNWVTDFIGFNDSNPTEQSGNYLALRFDVEPSDATVTVDLINGTDGKPPTQLDDDMSAVFRITDKATQKVQVVAKTADDTKTILYGLGGLTLNPSA